MGREFISPVELEAIAGRFLSQHNPTLGVPVPIVFGLPFGHSRQGCLTIPLGVRARLNAGEKVTLTLLEPAVSVPAKPRRSRH